MMINKIKIFITKFFLKDFVIYLIPKNQKSIIFWKEYFFNVVFFFIILLNSIIFIASAINLIIRQIYFPLLVIFLLFCFTIIFVYTKKIPFFIRSYIACFTFYLFGLFLFIKFGPTASGLLWFFLFSIFNASFNGIKGVIYSNIVMAITIIIFIIIIPLYNFNWLFIEKEFYSSNTWWITGVNLLMLNLVSSASIYFFMNNLEGVILKNVDSRNAIIFGLASLTEFRDSDTGKHLERISKYSKTLIKELQKKSKYKNYITESYIEDLEISSILHDIGKVGIEDKILLKKGKLTKEEFEKIKMHTLIGGHVIESINKKMQDKNFLKLANQIILYHHEKWDGTGYPEGLKGNNIPLSARIVALADVYDALISKRVYKEAISHEDAVKIIINEKRKYFDPEIINIFRKINLEFKEISESLK
jgi:HD-GYP domain-containing protein (c-di-GMP phosphodiesterase class II)